MKKLFFILLIVFVPHILYAQTSAKKTVDEKFIIVSGLVLDATIFDVETTFAALNKCSSCMEGNPLMRPFVKSGRPAIYAVEMGINAGIIYYSYKLKKNGNKLWWLMPVMVGTAHSVAGGANLRFSTKFIF